MTSSAPDREPDAGRGDDGSRSRARRLARAAGVVVLLAAVAAAGAVAWATRTDSGRRAVASWVEGRLEGAVRGRVEVGEVTGGNLFTRVEVTGFSIREPDGEPFLVLEGVRAGYDPLALLRGRFAFRDVRLERARLVLRQDEDGSWNFERLFPEDAAGDEDAEADGGTHVSLHDVRVRDGRVEVRTPYEPTVPDSLEVWRVERTPEGGAVRAIVIDSLRGRFPLLRVADPGAPMRLELQSVSGRALAVRQALGVRDAHVTAVFRDTIRVRIRGAGVGHSELAGEGWVIPADPPQYRFDLRAEPMDFRDLQWLPVPVPEAGGGPADLVVRSVGEDVAVDVRGGDVRVRDSRVRGDLTVVAAATPRIDTLDVGFEPLRLATVDRILGRPTAVDGYLEGRLAGGGPIDRLRLSGDLSARDTAGGGRPSRVRLEGAVSLEEPNPVHDLRLLVESFEPKWAGAVAVRPEVGGRVHGSLWLDGAPEDTFSFRVDLRHRSPAGRLSRIRGRGTVAEYGEERLELDLEMSPLALEAAEGYLPRADLTGEVRGSVRTDGDLSRLRADASLAGGRGEVDVSGTFGVAARPVSYDARLTAREVQLQRWIDGGPYTRLNLRASVRGTGARPEDLEAEFDLEVLPSVVEGVLVDTSRVRFSVEEGLATVDSFAVRTDAGEVRGRGAFGLEEGRSGSMVFTGRVPDLSSWNRWLVPGRNPVRPDTSVAELFEGFPDVEGAPEVAGVAAGRGAPVDTLAGSLLGQGVLTGNLEDFSAQGILQADSLRYGEVAADSVAVSVDLARPRGLDSLLARGDAWGVRVGEATRLDSLLFRWARRGGSVDEVRFLAARDTSVRVEAEGEVAWADSSRAVRVDRLRLRVLPQELTLERPAEVRWGPEGVSVGELRLSGPGGIGLEAGGRLPREGPAEFDVRLRDFDLEVLRRLARPEVDYGGSVDGAVRVRGTAAEPEISGFLDVGGPSYGGVGLDSLTSTFEYRDRSVSFAAALRDSTGRPALEADGSVAADLSLREVEDRIPDDPVDVTLRAEDVPLRLAEAFTPSLTDVRGRARGEVRITGSPDSLRYAGRVEATGISAGTPALGVRWDSEGAGVRFVGGEARLDSLLLASSAGGRLTVTGTVGLARPTDPALDLSMSARKLRAVDRRAMSFVVDGSARLTGSYQEPALTGEARVSNGEISVSRFMRERDVVDLTAPEAYSLIDTTLVAERKLVQDLRNPFLQNLRLQALLRVGPDLWLRSPQLDVELAGELRVRMSPEEEQVQLFGPLRLVRGQYLYSAGPYSRQLQIQSGTIEFVGTPGVNPNLNVTARYRTRGPTGAPVTIRATVGGTLIEKTLTLSSDVRLSQSDQICYLLFGSPCARVAGPSRGVGAGLTQTVQEQLVGSVGSQLSSLVVADTWLDYVSVQTGSLYGGARGGRADFLGTSFFAGTEVEAGKYLGEDVFVSVTYPLGSELPGATVDWEFLPSWTLEARSQNRFSRGLLSLGTNVFDTQRMWGLFLFREWEF